MLQQEQVFFFNIIVAGQGLSIYGDHNDVMAVRPSGVVMLSSTTRILILLI